MGLIIDNFAGAGGASLGIEMALGRHVDYAINHNPHALTMHEANHPHTTHLCEDVFDVSPRKLCAGRPVDLAWFSPDCKHFSKAKGGKPVEKKIRGLAWVALRWAKEVRPRVIILENVEEFQDWGPLCPDGRPDKARKGETFSRFVGSLQAIGYRVDWRELVAADFGAPTIRKRLFLVARCDGGPIVWPTPTHGAGLATWRTAAECIDWSLPCPSIFDRKRPLKENTLRRIAEGIRRYVLNAAEPFILTYYGPKRGEFRGQSLREPLRTQPTENRHALVTAFLAKHYGGVVGHEVDRPLGTVTAVDHHSLCSAFLTKFYGTNCGADLRDPMPTVTATGQHLGEVRAFLIKYYGQGCGQSLPEPMHTVTVNDRFGLVTIHGQDYQIVDIGLRMLQPRELARAQGFPDSYRLLGTKTQQVAGIGNSVCPPVAAAVVRANVAQVAQEVA